MFDIEDIIADNNKNCNELIVNDITNAIHHALSLNGESLSAGWKLTRSDECFQLYLPFDNGDIPLVDLPITIDANKLRYYQEECLEILKLLVNDEYYFEDKHFRELIINLPTGTGKTRIFLELLAWWETFNIVVIAAPTIALLRQLEQNTKKFLNEQKTIEYQVICSDKEISVDEMENESDADIQELYKNHGGATTKVDDITEFMRDDGDRQKIIFCTYKSLSKVAEVSQGLGIDIDLLIGDEGHRMCDKPANKLLGRDMFPVKYKAMFTATVREKISNTTRDMDFPMTNVDLFGPVAYKKTVQEMVDGGFILPPKILHTSWQDEYSHELLRLIGNGLIGMEDDVKNEFILFVSGLLYVYKKTGKIKCITFTQSLSVAKWYKANAGVIVDVLQQMLGHPIKLKAFVISQEVQGMDRQRLLNEFANCDNGLLLNYQVIKEGIDINDCNCVGWLRKMDAVGLTQSMGRCMRIDPDDPAKKLGYIICPVNTDKHDKGRTIERMIEVTRRLIEEGYSDIIVDELNNSDHTTGDGTGDRRDIREINFIELTLNEVNELGNNVIVKPDGEIVMNPWYSFEDVVQAGMEELV